MELISRVASKWPFHGIKKGVTIYLLSGMILQVCGTEAFSSSSAALTPAMLLLVASAALSAYTFYLIGTLVEWQAQVHSMYGTVTYMNGEFI